MSLPTLAKPSALLRPAPPLPFAFTSGNIEEEMKEEESIRELFSTSTTHYQTKNTTNQQRIPISTTSLINVNSQPSSSSNSCQSGRVRERSLEEIQKEKREIYYKNSYQEILKNKEHLTFKFKINHEEHLVTPDRISTEYFDYLKDIAKNYGSTIFAHKFVTQRKEDTSQESFEKFKVYLAMLVEKFSKKNFIDLAYESCKDYVQKEELIEQCHVELEKHNGNLKELCWSRFAQKIDPAKGNFNEQKVREFYADDPEFDKLLELAKFGVKFETDPDFEPNREVEPIRPLQQKLQKVYDYHVDKLVMAGRAMIFDLRKLNQETKDSLNICSLHLAAKPSTDELPIDPNSGDRKGRLCFDYTNRADGKLALNGGETKTLNLNKFGQPTNPTAGKIVQRWIKWKAKTKCRWDECVLARQDVDAAFNQLSIYPDKASLMTAALTENYVVVHDAGNFGHSALPAAYGVISRATKRAIEKHMFEGVLSVVTDDYIFLTLRNDFNDSNFAVKDVVERATFGANTISKKKELIGLLVGVYGFFVNLVKGTMRPMEKGIHKLTLTVWLFDVDKRQPLQLWQCLASLCEYYSHAIRGTRAMIRVFEEMTLIANSTQDKKAIATPLTKAIVEMWRIITLLLFYEKDNFNVTIEDFCRSSYCERYNAEWEHYESLQDEKTRPKRYRMISDAGPHYIGVGIYSYSYRENSSALLAYSSIHLDFNDPTNIYQNHREYLGLLMSLLVMKKYQLQNHNKLTSAHSEQIYVEWLGDNIAALKWADKNKASSRTAQIANLMISWFSIVANIQLYDTQHISGEEMQKLGIDALSRPEKGIPPGFPLEKRIDIQEKLESTGIMSLCTPSIETDSIEEVHKIFKNINDSLYNFCKSNV